jgi:AraC-like DNA-binding protein
MYVLADGSGVRARDCVCGHGVRSPVLEGQFGRAQISVVLAGAFYTRCAAGAGVVGPGALMLGNAGAGYEFRHVVDGGDRSIVFDYDDAVLDGVAGSLALPGARFRASTVPAAAVGVEAVVLAEQALRGRDPEALHEAALAVAMLALAAERRLPLAPPSVVQARRVARAVRHIEAHSAGDCSLEALAAEARLSRFHFLRVFRAMTGQTPRQYVIAARLRAAATALRGSRLPIARVATDAGFGDLSHFTASFSVAFGASPRAYRRRAAAHGAR